MKRLFKHVSDTQIEVGIYALVLVIVGFGACMAIWNSGELWARLWSMLCTITGPLLFGCMLSYMINPLVTHIERTLASNKTLTKGGANMRPAAAIITVIIVTVVLLAILGGLAAVLSDGFVSVGLGSLQDIIARMTTDFEGFATSIARRVESLGIISKGTVEGLLSTFTNVSIAFTAVFFTFTFTIWLLIDGDNVFVFARHMLARALGERGIDTAQMLLDADRVFSSYSRGQATDALALFLLTTLALSFVGVPRGLIATAVVCAIEQDYTKLLIGLIAMTAVMLLDILVIAPRLLADSIQLHPMVVAIVMFVGGTLGGVPGMVVAIPLATWIHLQFYRWMGIAEDDVGQDDEPEKADESE